MVLLSWFSSHALGPRNTAPADGPTIAQLTEHVDVFKDWGNFINSAMGIDLRDHHLHVWPTWQHPDRSGDAQNSRVIMRIYPMRGQKEDGILFTIDNDFVCNAASNKAQTYGAVLDQLTDALRQKLPPEAMQKLGPVLAYIRADLGAPTGGKPATPHVS